MENINRNKCFCHLVHLFFVFFLGLNKVVLSQNETPMVYIATLKQLPTINYLSDLSKSDNDLGYARRGKLTRRQNERNYSRSDPHYTSYLIRFHDSLLKRTFKGENYQKLYSYHYLTNGFAVLLSPQQAKKLENRNEVANVVPDFSVRLATTHTPEFLGLPGGAWVIEGGPGVAGQGIVIGFIDTGIDPTHPSFSDDIPLSPIQSRHIFLVLVKSPRIFHLALAIASLLEPVILLLLLLPGDFSMLVKIMLPLLMELAMECIQPPLLLGTTMFLLLSQTTILAMQVAWHLMHTLLCTRRFTRGLEDLLQM